VNAASPIERNQKREKQPSHGQSSEYLRGTSPPPIREPHALTHSAFPESRVHPLWNSALIALRPMSDKNLAAYLSQLGNPVPASQTIAQMGT
jgi:hypothetical protein